MREIDEGNKVIYEAAGEEANVIFGMVHKEDMNEYVSYTVIATGFNADEKPIEGASLEVNNKEEKQEKQIAIGGFNPKNFTVDPDGDLDIPTIQRIKASRHSFTKEENSANSANSANSENLFPDDSKSRSTRKPVPVKEESEDDSSSFLRMMMD